MRKLFWATLFIGAYAYSQSLGTSDTPELQVTELQENGYSSGISNRYCLVVYKDGRFHLERRVQQSPNPTNTLLLVDSRLNANQLRSLQETLSALSFSTLPAYKVPSIPMVISSFTLFSASITKNGVNHKVGYIDWQDKDRVGSPNTSSDGTKQGWLASKVGLSPLVLWVHQLESSKLLPSGAESNACK